MSSGSSKAPSGCRDFYHMSHQELPRSLIQQHFKQLWPVSRLITTTREPSEMPGECHSIGSLAGFSWSLGLLFCLSLFSFFFFYNQCLCWRTRHKRRELTLSPSGPGRPKSPGIPMKPCRRGKKSREDGGREEERGGNTGCECLDVEGAAGGTTTPLGSRTGFRGARGSTVQHG